MCVSWLRSVRCVRHSLIWTPVSWTGYLQKSWNKVHKNFEIEWRNPKSQLNIAGIFLSGNWRYYSIVHAVYITTLFSVGQLMYRVMFSCVLSVFLTHLLLQSRLTGGERNIPRHQLPLACKYFYSQPFLGIRRIVLEVTRWKKLGNTSLGIVK